MSKKTSKEMKVEGREGGAKQKDYEIVCSVAIISDRSSNKKR